MKTIITIAVALFIGAISTRQYQRAPTRSEIHNQRLYEAETEDLTVEDPLYYDGYYPQVEKNIFTKIGHGLRRVEPYIGPAFKIAGAIGGLSVEEPMFHDNVQYPQVEKNIFTKIGHGLRRVEPYIGPAFKIAGAIGGLSVQDQLSHEEEDYAYYPKVEKNVFTKIGHGLRRIEPYIGPAFKIAGAIGGLSVESPNPSPIYFYNDAFFPNVEKNIFTKIGHGLRRIEPYIGPAIKIAGAVGGLSVQDPYYSLDEFEPEVQRSIFNKIGDGFKTAGKDIAKGAKIAAPYAIPALEIAGTIALGGLSVEEPNVQQVFYGPNYYPYPYPYPYYD